MAGQPLGGQVLLIVKVPRSHSDTSQSVGLLRKNDRPVSETSTWQNTTLSRHPPRYSNPQSQQSRDRRPTP